MKTILALAIFSVCLALVVGEGCRSVSDCNHEHCDSTSTLECHHTLGPAGTCTCTTFQSCSGTASGCSGRCASPRQWHCIDNVCKCGYTGGK